VATREGYDLVAGPSLTKLGNLLVGHDRRGSVSVHEGYRHSERLQYRPQVGTLGGREESGGVLLVSPDPSTVGSLASVVDHPAP
jgi:hypothetical protein